MLIERIFADVDVLLSMKYEESYDAPNEFGKIADLWDDVELLTDFFTEHEAILKEKWKCTVENAVLITRLNASIFFRKLNQIRKIENPEEKFDAFLCLFKPLSKNQATKDNINEKKVHVSKDYNWLRLYALNFGDSYHIITGGAIKLTRRMEEAENTKCELRKFERVRDFFIENGIIDKDGLEDYLIELEIL